MSLLLVVTLVCVACSSKEQLTGRVFFDDGEPLTFGTVYLTDEMMMYRGSIGKDGSFDVGELRDGDGLPAGTYKVWLEDVNTWEPVLDKNGERTDKIIETIVMDRKYAKRFTSDLTVEVKPGEKNTLEIRVPRATK